MTSTEFESVNAAVKGQCVKPLHQLAIMVGLDGLEPSTSRLSGVRSNHLSYKPIMNSSLIITSSIIREKIKLFFDELKEQIKKLHEKNMDKIIKIGIVGAPNVGKNSLIQSLELIVNSNCDEKYIYFDEEKTFCVNSVPCIAFDEDVNNNFLISKMYKEVKDVPEPMKLISNLMNIVNKEKLKDIYELNKAPENLDEFIVLIKEKYEFQDNNITLCKILEDIITGKISYEVNI